MKRLFLFIFTFVFIFSFDIRTLAYEGHTHAPNVKQAAENLKKGNTNDQNAVSGNDAAMNHDSGSEMEGMDHSSGSGMEGMDMEGVSSSEDHNHHAAEVETPPNYKVLGTYGAVNLSFIILGVWNKWFRRKVDLNNGNA